MKISRSLPSPSADAIHHSHELLERIRTEIDNQGGSISFRRYMEMALYEPGLGYYVAGQRKLGASGDFITAPEISPLFSQCVANQCAQVLEKLANEGDILELGAGSGMMASDILLHLESIDCLPRHYYILDLSPALKEQQRSTVKTRAPHLYSRITWLSTLPTKIFSGVIVANEVLDAMPVESFTQTGNSIYQNHVIWKNNQLQQATTVAKKNYQSRVKRLNINSTEAFSSEFNPNITAWIEQLEQCLDQGIILLIDYGYSRAEYYHPQRSNGTLICHYQHLVHNDFFWYPGLQDITANVDFTHVAEAADSLALKAGSSRAVNRLTVSGFTNQASFLAACGLEDLFIQALTQAPDQQYLLAQQIRTLSLPSEMGERFKVIALSKGVEDNLIGFSVMDYSHKL